MRDPIDHLLQEHREIMDQVAGLRRAVRALEERGEAAVPEALTDLRAVAAMMETVLRQHARKEDEVLFPALERVFGTQGTPTAVMRLEHQWIHEHATRFQETLRELNEVEHPAIVAGGERLSGLAAGGGSAEELRSVGSEILRLLDLHFGKEEDILFPMARRILEPATLAEVGRKMEEITSG